MVAACAGSAPSPSKGGSAVVETVLAAVSGSEATKSMDLSPSSSSPIASPATAPVVPESAFKSVVSVVGAIVSAGTFPFPCVGPAAATAATAVSSVSRWWSSVVAIDIVGVCC